MKLEELIQFCLYRQECKDCPKKKECKKWREAMNKVTEPWEMPTVLKKEY